MTILTGKTHQTKKSQSQHAGESFYRLARLRYAGHVACMAPTRIPKIMLFGEVHLGQRNPGRPKKCFTKGLKNDVKAFECLPIN